MRTTRGRRIVRRIVFILPIFLIVFAGLVLAVRELWNGLMPTIFGLRVITYWQALGLMVLSWLLFRGFRGPNPGYGSWRYAMRRRGERRTPAEREAFIKGLNSRCGAASPPEPDPEPRA